MRRVNIKGQHAAFAVLILLCVPIFFYFQAFAAPYMMRYPVHALGGWRVSVAGEPSSVESGNLRKVVGVGAGVPVAIARQMEPQTAGAPLADAAILLKSNHQNVRVFLDDEEIFSSVPPVSADSSAATNPGIALHFVPLPGDYAGRKLLLDYVSPYKQYSGVIGTVYFGDIPSLEAFALSKSMRNFVVLIACLVVGFGMIGLFFIQSRTGEPDWGNFFFGLFAVAWALYAPSTEYAILQFFSPLWASWTSIGLYFLFPLPFMLFFLYEFKRTRKAFLPFVILRALFTFGCFALQIGGVLDLPAMIDINNAVYLLCLYVVGIFASLECLRGATPRLRLAMPWVVATVATVSHNLYLFYSNRPAHSYLSYQIVYTLFIVLILAHTIYAYTRRAMADKIDAATLENRNQMAYESYRNITQNMKTLDILQHDIKNHLQTLGAMLRHRRFDRAQYYVDDLLQEMKEIAPALYTRNFLVNSILSSKFSNAAQEGIRVAHDVQIPLLLDIADKDVCSVLTNIFDNAVEACRRVEDSHERTIELKLSIKNGFFCILCKNSKPDAAEEAGGGTEDKKRGYGLPSIERTVQKYDGLMNIQSDGRVFTISVAMQNRQPT